MANTNPRRKVPGVEPVKRLKNTKEPPWGQGDPTRMYGLNTPLPEPLMLMLDFMVENRVISSKASFIREIVEREATAEINRFIKMQAAMKKLDAGPKKKA